MAGGRGRHGRSMVRVLLPIRSGTTAPLAAGAGRQRRGRRGGRFLDGSRVVVLVAGQGGAAGEGLLAVGVGTFVWSLPRMDATMPCERGRITERLQQVRGEDADGDVDLTLPHRSHM